MLLANVRAVMTAVLGVLGLFFPISIARVPGVEPANSLGNSELRARPFVC